MTVPQSTTELAHCSFMKEAALRPSPETAPHSQRKRVHREGKLGVLSAPSLRPYGRVPQLR
eukprot:14606188-Alexandrium_andersonii.AAC.1